MLYTRIKHIALLFCCCLSLATAVVQAQVNYPVMATVQLNPPYSLYLSDYAAPDVQRMQVTLLMKDLSETNYKCRLRLKIEGFGSTLQSKAAFYTAPILLNGGEMVTLSGPDLAPYLDPKNLLIQGLDNSQLTRNGAKLPEGIYKFTVEVLDYTRNNVISNAANAVISTFLSYPPIINLPMADTKVDALNPQNVVFQWMPRHTASFNAAFNVVYKFRLVQLIPADRNPNDALRTTRPLLETIVPQTMLVYGPGEPALTPGARYAVQVQAIEVDGKDMFINDGYSEAVAFTYGEKCSVPQDVIAAVDGRNSLKLTWSGTPAQQAFTVRYREAGDHPSQWYEEDAYMPQLVITGLKAGKKYEYQVNGQCVWGYGDYTPVQAFTMPDAEMQKGDFVCGSGSGSAAVINREDIAGLQVGDTVTAGDFRVVISKVSGGQGTFSGTGEVLVPFLNYLSLTVTFSNIRVNTGRQMYEGMMQILQDDPGRVSATLQKTLTDLLDNIDNTLQNTDLASLQQLDAAGLMQQIDKMKDWSELSAATKEDLGKLDSQLQQVKQLQQDNGMTPEEKATLAQKVGKDIKDVVSKMKEDLKTMGAIIKELLGIFRKAQAKVRKEYSDQIIQQLQQQMQAEEKALDTYIKSQRDKYSAGGASAGADDFPAIMLGIQTGTAAPQGSGTSPAARYGEAEKKYNRASLLRTLSDSTITDSQASTIVRNLSINEQSGEVYLKQTEKDGTSTETKVDALSAAIIRLGDKLLKEKIYKVK